MSFTTQAWNFNKELIRSDIAPSIRLYGSLAAGETVTAEKFVFMYTSRDVVDPVKTALAHHHAIMEISAAESVPDKHYELLREGTVQGRPCKHVDAFETSLVEH